MSWARLWFALAVTGLLLTNYVEKITRVPDVSLLSKILIAPIRLMLVSEAVIVGNDKKIDVPAIQFPGFPGEPVQLPPKGLIFSTVPEA
jgi:hypothetical protein